MNEDKLKQLGTVRKMAGGVRIHQKSNKSGLIASLINKKNNESSNYSNLIIDKIKKVNEKISRMPEMEFMKLRDIFTKYIQTLSEKLVRDVWENRSVYKIYRSDKNVWLTSFLFKNNGTTQFDLKDDISDGLREFFTMEGQRVMLSFIDSIDAVLVNPESFKKQDPTETFDMNKFKSSLSFFGLNPDEKVTFTRIKSAYNELLNNLENDEDGSNRTLINEHYVFLRDNYETYLIAYKS